MTRIITGALLGPAASLLLLGAAFAQDVTMGNQTIPADQVRAVQDWCKQLQSQQGLTGTQEPKSTMTEEQAAVTAGAQVEGEGETQVDLNAITLEMCQDAGFTGHDGE